MSYVGPFREEFVEACRVARLRRHPQHAGQAGLKLGRYDFYGWKDTWHGEVPELHVAVIADPRPVVIVHDRTWWVPRLDQLLECLETAVSLRRPGGCVEEVREFVVTQLVHRIGDRRWEDVALEMLLEQG